MSTARQTVWLETRVVPLTNREWPLRPSEVGSPWAFGRRPYFSDEGHQEHVHIGYGIMPP